MYAPGDGLGSAYLRSEARRYEEVARTPAEDAAKLAAGLQALTRRLRDA